MNVASDDTLRSAAESGDIDSLYSVIGENPNVLEEIDSIKFVDTPMHVAASAGHHRFAIEIMRLKPSFALKLNPQGFTPIHLALQNNQNKMVRRLVDINEDLIRVKGREGLTPLHFVSQVGEIDLLVWFLRARPYSIKDVTVRNETALHIAVRHGQYEALQVLVGWLMRTSKLGEEIPRRILNLEDEDGNTILHVSTRLNDSQMIQLLIKSKVNLKGKNDEGRSALDITPNEEIRNMLIWAGANSSVADIPAIATILKLNMTLLERIIIFIRRITSDITEEQRNAYLIIATIVITTTYESALSPPGGVYQANAGDDNVINATNCLSSNITILNSTATATQRNHAGTSVMPGFAFTFLSIFNFLCFGISTMITFILTPPGGLGTILTGIVTTFASSYLFSMFMISPTKVFGGFYLTFLVPVLFFAAYSLFKSATTTRCCTYVWNGWL